MVRKVRGLGAGLLALALAACGVEHPVAEPPRRQQLDLGPRAPVSEPVLPPDQDGPRCGDDICQWPEENLVNCTADCRPHAERPPPVVPDPGYVDPAPAPLRPR